MKMRTFLATALLTLSLPSAIRSQDYDVHFKPLESLLNKQWEGEMKSPDGSQAFKTVDTFRPIWGGKIIKYAGSVKDLGSFSEGYFYWNEIAKRIGYYCIGSSGCYLEGVATVDGNVVTIEGKMVWTKPVPRGFKPTYNFRNTFEFIDDHKMIDRWFQNANGTWQPGHVVEKRAVK